MALARIITRSQACALELSQDLLARGYVVEVVSPDEVPAHTADLELRVETGEGNKLTANVKVQQGERSASFDFVHQFSSPVPDSSRAEPQPVPNRTNPLVSPQPQTVAVATLAIAPPEIAGGGSLHPGGERSGGWFWRTAFGFAATVFLALVVGGGVGSEPGPTDSVESDEISGSVPDQVSAPAHADWLNFVGPAENTGGNSSQEISLGLRSDLQADRVPEETTRPNLAAATGGVASEATGKTVHDLVARDTVTYLDERYKPAPKTQLTNPMVGQQAAPRKHGGVIAANSVTDLNDKATSKPK